VDVIVAPAVQAVRAAKQSTTTIPIIFPTAGDAVASGLVASLARRRGEHYRVNDSFPRVKWEKAGIAPYKWRKGGLARHCDTDRPLNLSLVRCWKSLARR
jgi:hypothetical protein